MGDGNRSAICLYAPISQAAEYAPVQRSRRGALKAAALRLRDTARWHLLHRHGFAVDPWRTHRYTNLGDVAIRHAIRQLLQSQFGPDQEFLELSWGDLSDENIARINSRCKLFVICGGGFVFLDAKTGEANRRLDDVIPLRRIACPVVAFGIGFNSNLQHGTFMPMPEPPASVRDKLRELAERCCPIGVRDTVLLEMLERLGNRPIDMIGDPALFLAPDPHMPPARRKTGGKLRIGVNCAVHGPASAQIFQRLFPEFVRFLKRVQKDYQAEFIYFVHTETESLAIKALEREGVKLDVVRGAPEVLVRSYAEADIVVCQMLHSAILAAAAGVPSMNIAYDRKNSAFYNLMGLGSLCIPYEEADEIRLVETFQMLVAERSAFAKTLTLRREELRAATHSFLRQIAARLATGDPSLSTRDPEEQEGARN